MEERQRRPSDGLRAILSARSNPGRGSHRPKRLKWLRKPLRLCEHVCMHNALACYTREKSPRPLALPVRIFPRAPGLVAHPYAVARPSQEGWTGVRCAGLGNPPGARALTESDKRSRRPAPAWSRGRNPWPGSGGGALQDAGAVKHVPDRITGQESRSVLNRLCGAVSFCATCFAAGCPPDIPA